VCVLTIVVVAAAGCTNQDPNGQQEISSTAWRTGACSLPRSWMRRIARGTQTGEGRGTDLIVAARPPHYVGTPTDAGHSGVAAHLQNIPLVFYGPGQIRAEGAIKREATLASVAPTIARMLDFDLEGADESPITEVLVAGAPRPKLVVTTVIDGGGWNVLRRWPQAWPHVDRLMSEGTSVVGATVGSSPSVTPASHTTLGTGVYPRKHGVTAIVVRQDGELTGAFTRIPRDPIPHIDPSVTLEYPTLAELYDRSEKNVPTIAMVGFGSFITGMIGRGSAFPRGDKDIAAIVKDDKWFTEQSFYALPGYVEGIDEKVDEDLKDVDRIDGMVDGRWRGHATEPLLATPAFSAMVRRALVSLIDRERMGKDGTPDLLFANFKAPDSAGHLWNMTALEQRDAIASVDDAIGKLVERLDREVGEGNWVLVLTADHGQTPIVEDSWPISMRALQKDAEALLDSKDNGKSLFQRSSNTMLYLDRQELQATGVSPEQIASFVSTYTIGNNATKDLPAAWESKRNERLFSAAFPVRRLDSVLTCTSGSKDAE
jgi:arylsulfatase A-like enzyme